MDCILLGKYHVSVIGVEAVMIRNYLLQRRTGGGMTRFQQAMVLAGVGAAIVSSAAGLLQADTILKNGTVITVEHPLLERGDLWVTAKDLERINGLALKPPGVLCLGDVCINLSQKGDNALLRKRDGQDWVNVTGLAKNPAAVCCRPGDEDLELRADPGNAHAVFEISRRPELRTAGPQGENHPSVGLSRQEGAARHVGLVVWLPA